MADPTCDRATTRNLPGTAIFITGVVALGFDLRAPITSLPPVFPELSATLHLSGAVVAVLAAVPVLCFGAFSPVAAPLARWFGEERVLLAAAALLAGGLLLRGALGSMLFPGTVIACGAIAFLNVLLPSLIKRRIPDRAGLLIGVYLMSLSAGAVLGSLVAVPVFQASGGSAAVALGLWAVPAAVAALVWLPQWRFRTAPEGQTPQGRAAAGISAVVRHLLAWQVMAYMGLQSLTYYAALSWLPVLLRDRGAGAVNAGGQLALVNLGNAATALLLPVLAHRARDQRLLVAVTAALTAAGLGGVWFAPLWTSPAWALMLGFGQGASLGLAIYMMTARSPGPQAAASLSGFAQGGGYLVAAAGPLVTGFLHTASGGWSLPVIVLLLFVAAQCAVGWPAARNRLLPVAAG